MTTMPYQAQKMEIICETPDVRVAEITLSPLSDTSPHQHTEAEEICYYHNHAGGSESNGAAVV